MKKNKSTTRIKNTLFDFHKEEASNISKSSKQPELETSPKPKKTDSFQLPNSTPKQEKSDKKSNSGFTRVNSNNLPVSGTPVNMTPIYDTTGRNVEQMPMYGGMNYFDQSKGFNDFAGGQYQDISRKSPLFTGQSPGPTRYLYGFGPETPQASFNLRSNTWAKTEMSRYMQVSTIYSGRL